MGAGIKTNYPLHIALDVARQLRGHETEYATPYDYVVARENDVFKLGLQETKGDNGAELRQAARHQARRLEWNGGARMALGLGLVAVPFVVSMAGPMVLLGIGALGAGVLVTMNGLGKLASGILRSAFVRQLDEWSGFLKKPLAALSRDELSANAATISFGRPAPYVSALRKENESFIQFAEREKNPEITLGQLGDREVARVHRLYPWRNVGLVASSALFYGGLAMSACGHPVGKLVMAAALGSTLPLSALDSCVSQHATRSGHAMAWSGYLTQVEAMQTNDEQPQVTSEAAQTV